MWFLRKKNNIDYENLVSTLEKGEDPEVKELLWQPKNGKVEYLSATKVMLQKLRKKQASDPSLSILKKIEKGGYELIIFRTPWGSSDLPYSPLILDKRTGKIVGVMLAFNELQNHISRKDNSIIGDLGSRWILFTIETRSKKNKHM